MNVKKRFFSFFMGIILLACTSINISQAANFRPESPQSVAKILKAIDGNWYDHSGNLVLQIQDGYINGCKILTVYDLAGASGNGGANFRILESTGERLMHFSWYVRHDNMDRLKVNDSQMLHRVAQIPFSESVAGIHLGMTPDEVKAVLGTPSQTGDLQPYWRMPGWYYADKKIVVTFDGDCVDRIILLRGSNTVLNNSGLNCSNTPSEFVQAYHMNRIPKVDFNSENESDGCYNIGNGEYLAFGNRMSYIMLTYYSY